MEPTLVRYAKIVPVKVMPGIWRRTLAWGERVMVLESTFEEEAELAGHSHPHEQITYLVSGELEMKVGTETHLLNSGDSVCVPPGVCHSAIAHKRTVAIDAFSPPREDFK